jgi:outer membrane protein OmpA-like peptidoglycan-associated protein
LNPGRETTAIVSAPIIAATGVGSSKALVSPEKTAADKQRDRRVLVQATK